MEGLISAIPADYIYWVCGGLTTIVGSLLAVGARVAFKAAKGKVEKFDTVADQLATMMSNHLPHIQQGVEGICEKQDETNLKLAEQTGYLRAIAEAFHAPTSMAASANGTAPVTEQPTANRSVIISASTTPRSRS